MHKSLWLVLSAILLLQSCATLTSPPEEPKPGFATIKGGTVVRYLLSAQYSYVVGYDGKLCNSYTGSKQIPAGTRRLALGASHAAGIQSFAEITLEMKPGVQYNVTADQHKDGLCHYTIVELPEKVTVATIAVPSTSGYGVYSAPGTVDSYWERRGLAT
ncbi:MAG: hypothetical protein Q7Q71_00695 [Verrucomicrobiota bacterium JB023]|nr:hypothetical protein [Verrucomicrobiota bacterium JB023]